MEVFKYNSYTTVIKVPFTEIEKIDMALCKQPRQTLEDFYADSAKKPDVLINGGFFSMADGSTCFNYKDEGQQINNTNLYKWGIGIIDEKILKYGSVDSRTDWRDFISGYPVYIDNYAPVTIDFAKEINYKARRSILAYDPAYLYIIAVDKPGMNFKDVQEMLVSYNVQYAINLDGGGSTRILQNGKRITSELYSRPVDNVLAVYLKKEEARTLYRVQAGAYSKRENAEVMLKKIKALGGIYVKAYVRKVDTLWKVQMGAFSVKQNALNMQKDLKSKGFNCFITTK